MSNHEYLFPRRQTRRDFLQLAGAAAMACAAGPNLLAADERPPVKFGSGRFTYTLDETWGQLPEGMKYGFGCAVVVDSQDRVYVTSRSVSPCVAVFDRDGKLLETWSKDFADKVGYSTDDVAATAHGLYWSKEPEGEFFYFTENKFPVKKGEPPESAASNAGRRVYKTDLQGKILYQIGNVDKESSTAGKFDFVSPTDVAVSANGDIYVVDGYGSQLLHRFDKNFKLIKTIGGPGTEHGKFKTCHGVWISTLKAEPELYIADRANGRIEIYLARHGIQADASRIPHALLLLSARWPSLHSRTRISGKHFGCRRQGCRPTGRWFGREAAGGERATRPDKFATPHALTVDSRGDLYVVEWLPFGRPRKFRWTPA